MLRHGGGNRRDVVAIERMMAAFCSLMSLEIISLGWQGDHPCHLEDRMGNYAVTESAR